MVTDHLSGLSQSLCNPVLRNAKEIHVLGSISSSRIIEEIGILVVCWMDIATSSNLKVTRKITFADRHELIRSFFAQTPWRFNRYSNQELEGMIFINSCDTIRRLADAWNVVDFAMNDKCAAGTDRFLKAMARALEVDIDLLGDLDKGATSDLVLSSMCTVFAESEVVSLIAGGT